MNMKMNMKVETETEIVFERPPTPGSAYLSFLTKTAVVSIHRKEKVGKERDRKRI